MPAGSHVAAGPRIGFLHIPGGKDLLVEKRHSANAIAPALVRPDARSNVVYRIDDVTIAIVGQSPMRSLREVAADRHCRVDQQVEPICRLFDERTSFEPDCAYVFAACEGSLHDIGHAREGRHRRFFAQITWTIRKEIDAAPLGRDVTVADIGSFDGSPPGCVTTRRQRANEIEVSFSRKQAAYTFVRYAQTIDFLEQSRTVGEERYTDQFFGRIFFAAVHLPSLPTGLARHIGNRIQTVFWFQCDLVDGPIALALSFFMEVSGGI